MTSYDVIVVGSGPSGSTTARHLAQEGLKTLLLEKEKMPRYKPCGGGLTAKVKNILDVDFSPTVEDTITRASVAYRDSIRFPVRFNGPVGWSVMRDKFDLLLANEAAKAGAEVRDAANVKRVQVDDTSVQIQVNGEELTSKVIVGADGANGIVARATGLHTERHLAAALEAEMELPNAAVEHWRGIWHLDFGAVPHGYAWIFPKAEHLSVGVGAFVSTRQKLNLRALLKQYIASEPTLQNPKHIALHGHTLPLGGTKRRVSASRVVLVGDAANLVDPFSGEGIYAAIKSGRLAAEHITNAFATGDFDFAAYTAQVQREFTRDYRSADRLGKIFYTMPVTLLNLYRRAEPLWHYTEAIARADMDYRTAIRKSLRRAPGYFLKRAVGKLHRK